MGSFLAAADVHSGDLSVLFILIALACFAGAAYLAFLRNVLGAIVLVFVGIVALLFGA
jgi:hypothetical protein